MSGDHDPQLLKGVLSLLLLHLLAEHESYGYEVVQRLHEIGLSDIASGTVYPALSRLERERRLTARLVASDEGPARKYYRPTRGRLRGPGGGGGSVGIPRRVGVRPAVPTPPASHERPMTCPTT